MSKQIALFICIMTTIVILIVFTTEEHTINVPSRGARSLVGEPLIDLLHSEREADRKRLQHFVLGCVVV